MKFIMLVVLLFLIGAVLTVGEIRDIRFLNGKDWLQWDVDAKMAFVRGFLLGSTSCEQIIASDKFDARTSMYGVSDKDMIQSINTFYVRTENTKYPIVSVIYKNAVEGNYERH